MKFSAFILVALMLAGCAGEAPMPQTAASIQPSSMACGQVAASSEAWTVEGFGGSEEQVIVSKRTPVKRCSPAVVQTRTATLAAAE